MVSQDQIRSSNALINDTLPHHLVAVFVGGTSGIGEYTVLQLAKHATKPKIYIVGRSEEASDRIIARCKVLNNDGEYMFMKVDASLLKNVDEVCREIKEREKEINIMVLSTGTLVFKTSELDFPLGLNAKLTKAWGIETEEGLHAAVCLALHARMRFVVNLLPLLQRANSLRRVITVFAGTKEGSPDLGDLEALNASLFNSRGHICSLITLSLEAIAKKAPNVSFIHDYPGPVDTGIGRGMTGMVMTIMKALFKVIGPLIYIPKEQSGERHLYLATSARYPARTEGKEVVGVLLQGGIDVARGTDGKSGSGVYSVDEVCESAGHQVEVLLAGLRKDGSLEKIWKQIESDFARITGSVST
jgi:NAD(P)-dependent dehydrogenase (short-subunit alcohol dehydrogenase family)